MKIDSRLQSARHFVADDQSAHRGRSDHVDSASKDSFPASDARETGAQIFGVLRMLQDARALQVLRAVQSAGQPEMSMQVCARAFEQRQNFVHRSMIELTDGSLRLVVFVHRCAKNEHSRNSSQSGSITYTWTEACTSGRLRLKKSTELASNLHSLLGIKMSMRKVQPYLAALMAAAISAPPSLAQQNTQIETSDAAWYSRMTDRYTHARSRPSTCRIPGASMRCCEPDVCICRCRMLSRSRSRITWTLSCSGTARRLAEADLLRAQAGGVVRGVPTGISQGPTSAASLSTGGGAGTGVAGAGGSAGGTTERRHDGTTVLFTGTQVPSLDEVLFRTTTGATAHRFSRIPC